MADVSGFARVPLRRAQSDEPDSVERRSNRMRSLRLWTVAGLMFFAAVVLHVRGDVDHAPYARPLTQLPDTIASRTSVNVPLDDETLAILGSGFYLNRLYSVDRNAPGLTLGQRADIDLFIAYLP